MDWVSWIAAFLFIIGLVLLGAWFLRGYLSGGSGAGSLFGGGRERRLSVTEHASVDGRRRLVLVRRDDVEHLIMTGGPIDVVIETGIGQKRPQPQLQPRERAGFADGTEGLVYTRPPREKVAEPQK